MARIEAICISAQRGTAKTPVSSARLVTEHGIEGDAHAGSWHRQVSLLSADRIEAFRRKGAPVTEGSFGENLIVSGLDLARLPVGTRLQIEDALLEITQIGKECHQHCAIHAAVGDCIMPREGVFARVLRGGLIHVGDDIQMSNERSPFRAVVITLSDTAFAGTRTDESGPLLRRRLEGTGQFVVEKVILIPDDKELLLRNLYTLSDQKGMDLILTTGSTGFSPKDIAPEATLEAAERMAPGISEAIRVHSLQITKRAMLSRGISVLRGKTLIINLPGSPKACDEALDCILDTLPHGLEILRGEARDCARQ